MVFGLPNFHQLKSDPFLIGWNFSAFLSIVAPLLTMVISRVVNTDNDDDDNGNNNDNNTNYYNSSPWWHFWGNNNNYNQDDRADDRKEAGVPWWWFGGREREPGQEGGQGVLIFVYVYIILLFIGLVLYGNYVFRRGTDFAGLQGALFVFTHLSFISMLLLAGLEAIEVDGPDLDETGWYGQLSVCMFLTCLIWVLDGIVFTALMRKRVTDSWSNYARSTGGYRAPESANSGTAFAKNHQTVDFDAMTEKTDDDRGVV